MRTFYFKSALYCTNVLVLFELSIDIGSLFFLHLEEQIHVHVANGTPLRRHYMSESG